MANDDVSARTSSKVNAMKLYRAHTWPHEQTERTGRQKRKRESTEKRKKV